MRRHCLFTYLIDPSHMKLCFNDIYHEFIVVRVIALI